MARQANPGKVVGGQQRLRRFEKSGLTVAPFCARDCGVRSHSACKSRGPDAGGSRPSVSQSSGPACDCTITAWRPRSGKMRAADIHVTE